MTVLIEEKGRTKKEKKKKEKNIYVSLLARQQLKSQTVPITDNNILRFLDRKIYDYASKIKLMKLHLHLNLS